MGKTENIVDVVYDRTGRSVNTNELGMREMQARAFEARLSQYLLIKAPPASGKSRALMFIALDKLYNQRRRKVIVAVPEKSIGGSFKNTGLVSNGFFADWDVKPWNNLCDAGSSKSKVEQFVSFLKPAPDGPNDAILVCTHATLRFAFEKLAPSDFDGCVLAIDEFHHVSADTDDNRLGALLAEVMRGSDCHIVAMTGSYFRGDTVPVLLPEVEEKFTHVTFNYYDQLNGYRYLKSLGIGHHFYQGRYLDAISEVLDLDKKTIIHIPSVNSGESTKDKLEEVGHILDVIAGAEDPGASAVVEREPESGILLVRNEQLGRTLRVADLVDDTDQKRRAKLLEYLQDAAENRDAVDIIIALGMAKEGFDWPFAEHALTVGYRASLTEVIQIIGRVTRDSEGKRHAQFTNLIAEPEASQDDVTASVNNMLKAITASLLMEQVLAPNFTFKAKKPSGDETKDNPGTLRIAGFKEPKTAQGKQIVLDGLTDIKAHLLQDPNFAKAAMSPDVQPEMITKVLIPKIVREKYPTLPEEDVLAVAQHVVVDAVVKKSNITQVGEDRFIKMAARFVNIDDLNINLIESINPFQKAYEVLSRSVTPNVLRLIRDEIDVTKIDVTEEEARVELPRITQAMKNRPGWRPDKNSEDPREVRDAEIVLYMQHRIRQREAQRRAAAVENSSLSAEK
ncbi:DEAD/DEAH box helicase [Corynebacterium aquilae]|uniref:ATP-dependent helicase n=1 Tax=Corynebacterium aquilae DSM 44791 TaxID=1431546 RepID=A0A1L7CEV2_9CORY|nr:ATP-dependent helicase [Corynebacterium aquilae]APT84410.1 ATP-dependent helicase [Corynebacterium aquilae DSM 44791]